MSQPTIRILKTADLPTHNTSSTRTGADNAIDEDRNAKDVQIHHSTVSNHNGSPSPPSPRTPGSAHIATADTRTFDDDLEAGIRLPEIAHIYGSTPWITLWPRQDLPISPTSSFSSGPTLIEKLEPAESASNSYEGRDLGRIYHDDEKNAGSITSKIRALPAYSDKIATTPFIDRLLQAYPLPAVTGPDWWNTLRHGFLSMYRRLHIAVLLANLIALVYCTVRVAQNGYSHYSYTDAANAVAANLFVGTLMRHEHAINFFFRMCTMLPHSTPLAIRRYAAKVYSYGGIHSACGISSLFWYIFYVVLLLNQFGGYGEEQRPLLHASQALTGVMLALFVILVVMAYPTIRSKYHDLWELSHRFAGWTAILVIWAQTVIAAWPVAEILKTNVGMVLIETPAFWFLIAISCMIIYPWLRLRRRAVVVESLSDRATRLRFNNRKVTSCVGTRLSNSPLTENHGFATIPNPDGEKGYSVIISKAGDWTSKIIKNPPSHIWMRGAHTMGVSRIGLLFKPVVMAATGSGIGPTHSFLQAYPHWPCRVVWSATYPEKTFGKEIMKAVLRADPHAIIVCRQKTGRYPMHELAYAAYKSFGAEAVVLISNPAETKRTVYELEARNVPAYGAIFDS